jgi:hypothetical protein
MADTVDNRPVPPGPGERRPGLDPDEILLLLGFLCRIDNSPDWAVHEDRLLDIVLDGLQARAPAAGRPAK